MTNHHDLLSGPQRMDKHRRGVLEPRQRTSAAARATARVRTTATPEDDGTDDTPTTATRRVRTTAAAAADDGAGAAAAAAPATALTGLAPAGAVAAPAASVAAVAPVSVVPQVLPTIATTAAAVSVASANSVDPAQAAVSVAPSAPKSANALTTGAKAGIAVGVVLGVLLIVGLGVFAFLRRRKAKAATGSADYSWSSKEKDVNFGTSPSRNVKSDASFGNKGGISAFGGFKRLSNASDHADALPPPVAQPANKTAPAGAFNPPRASFMNGPSGPPPSIGSLYGAAAPADAAAAQQGPFGDPPTTGKVYIVRRTFEPSLADELIIYPGDRVQILVSYDDGWSLGINLDSAKPGQAPQRGVFPRDCVDENPEDAPLGSGSADLHRAPTLPPMNFEGGNAPPAISVSSPESTDHRHKISTSNNSLLNRFPTPNPRPASSASQKRTSSLIAGKDSDLFSQMRFSGSDQHR